MIKNKKIVGIIEARMTSSRLPGKVLMEVNNKPLLEILIDRLSKSIYLDKIVVATTVKTQDDSIIDFCNLKNVDYFRGSEENVLDRVCQTAIKYQADIIVEITSDCPLIDYRLVDDAITIFLEKYPNKKYISNSGIDTSLPNGLDVQVFMAEDLYEINSSKTDKFDREHVSYKFYRPESGNKYKPYFIKYTGILNRPEIIITLDYLEDYLLIKKVYENLYPIDNDFSAEDIIEWLDKNPKIRDSVIKCRS